MRSGWELTQATFRLFSARGKLIVVAYAFSLVLLSGLDAIGLYLLTSVFQTTSEPSGGEITVNTSASTLSVIIFLFVARSALSTLTTWLATLQFAVEENGISMRAFAQVVNPRTTLGSSPTTDFYNAVERGPRELIVVTTNFVTLVAEVITGFVIFGALLFLQPTTAVLAAVYFLCVAGAQHRILSRKSHVFGSQVTGLTNSVYQLLADAAGLRRLMLMTGVASVTSLLSDNHRRLTKARGMVSFLASVPRYFLELVFALGLVIIGGSVYMISGPSASFAATTLFVAAGFRLLPVVNRVQALILSIISFAPTARLGLMTFPTVPHQQLLEPRPPNNVLEMSDVTFSYPTSREPVLHKVTLELESGKQYAVVGPSGAGKTTLVDLFLGLNVPLSGDLRFRSGTRIGYVPQDTFVATTSLAQNVAMCWNKSEIDYKRVRDSLVAANLVNFIDSVEDDRPISSESMSGGQRQRLGLARAFYVGAEFVVLDEVTSALDVDTEREIYAAVNSLRKKSTVVVIAHRLSTVQNADQVFYIESGRIAGVGTFSELNQHLPQFRRQIELSQIKLVD